MIPEEQHDRLKELVRVFLEENGKLNLSALRDEESSWIGNVLDSLPLLDLDLAKESSRDILDLGTGGGFPLLPLAMMKPAWNFTGLDSTGKKLDAIRRMCDALNLPNVQLLNARAEETAHDSRYRGHYDIVTARAVAPLNVLLELTVPFAKTGGHVVAWKSMHIEQELQEADRAREELRCTLIDRHTYTLPGDWPAGHSSLGKNGWPGHSSLGKNGWPAGHSSLGKNGWPAGHSSVRSDGWGTRQLLVFKKTGETPEHYPRETGIPKKDPL